MGKAQRFLGRLAQQAELETEPMPIQPVIEIAGDSRVLIENHRGIRAYSREQILICVKYGMVCVCGSGLKIGRMTKVQLVIQGRIDGVSLQRRGEK